MFIYGFAAGTGAKEPVMRKEGILPGGSANGRGAGEALT